MGATELASMLPAADRREQTFYPAAYAALRTEAVRVLRDAVDAFMATDDRRLGVAIARGQDVIRSIDGLYKPEGCEP